MNLMILYVPDLMHDVCQVNVIGSMKDMEKYKANEKKDLR